jgi:hypothetical protein
VLPTEGVLDALHQGTPLLVRDLEMPSHIQQLALGTRPPSRTDSTSRYV